MRRKVYQDALNKAIDFNLNRIKRPNPSTRIQVNDFNLKRSKNIIPITRTEVSELNLNRAKKITPIPLGALKVKGGKGKRYIAPTYDINIDYNLANVPITSFDPSSSNAPNIARDAPPAPNTTDIPSLADQSLYLDFIFCRKP